ncbi:MAG: hypothetical protein JWN23_2028 [Rhodocyclales bacterium]|nr:hypothetical protein [Rhodocyclales bacterium]
MIKLFRLFNHEAEKTLALELAAHFVKNIPPKLMDQRRQVLSANKVSRLLEQAFEKAKDHQEKVGMGFIKRAILANMFKWELKNNGYPQDFIEVATEGLVVELSRKTIKVKS